MNIFLDKISGICYEIYSCILKKQVLSALIVFSSVFVFKDILFIQGLYLIALITAIISALNMLTFNKKATLKECFIFAFYILLFFFAKDIITVILALKNALFASLTIVYYGIQIALVIIIQNILRTITAFVVYFLTNIILYKIFSSHKFQKTGGKISACLQKPLFSTFLFFIIILCPVLCNTMNYSTATAVEISAFSEIYDYYRYGFGENLINLMPDDRICFLNRDKLFVYDLKKHKLVNEYNISPDTDYTNNMSIDTNIFSLKNGNILIRQNIIPQDRSKYLSEAKSMVMIYSLIKNEIISQISIPLIPDVNNAMVEMPNNKVMFIGGIFDKYNKTFILDLNNNTIIPSADLHVDRTNAEVLLLNDGKIFVLGGMFDKDFPDNFAEIYDPKKDVFTKIPLNFTLHDYIRNIKLSLIPDGRVLILCEKVHYKQEDGIGKMHGFRISDDKFVTVYPAPYLAIFNPEDNSFEEINVNRNNKYLREGYDAAVLKDGRILIAGGQYISKKSYKRAKYANDLLIYDPLKQTFKETSKKLKYNHSGNKILYVLDDGRVLISGHIYVKPTPENQIEEIIIK